MASIIRVRSTIQGTTGLPGVSTAFFSAAGTVATAAEATDVAARVRAFWLSAAGILAAGVTVLTSGVVDSLNETTGFLTGQTTGTTPGLVTSSGTGEAPSATMMGLRLSTGTVVGSRLLQGRWFVGPLAANVNSGGVPTAAAVTALLSGTTGMLTGTTSSVPRVWHRPKAHLGGGAFAVTGYSADVRFWYLRSRRD
jgi:hypothetical protein